jgi:putative thioredoxin
MVDVTDASFQTDVIERSRTVPVVVDLWAPWCEPCKTLGPILEKAIADTAGKVELAKVDVDANPQIAQSFEIQGIPAVYAIKDGEVVNGFVGAKGESEITAFVNDLLPDAQEQIIEKLLEDGTESSLEEVLQAIPDHSEAIVRLASIYIDNENSEAALDLLKRIPESQETRHIAARARTGSLPENEILEKLDELLPHVKVDEDARIEFVDLLDVLGPENVEVKNYRQKLSRALY